MQLRILLAHIPIVDECSVKQPGIFRPRRGSSLPSALTYHFRGSAPGFFRTSLISISSKFANAATMPLGLSMKCWSATRGIGLFGSHILKRYSSSKRWQARQLKDRFTREAAVQGLKSRAAFKLLQVLNHVMARHPITTS